MLDKIEALEIKDGDGSGGVIDALYIYTAADLGDGDITVSDAGSDTLITFYVPDSGGTGAVVATMTLTGITDPTTITATDFEFDGFLG